MSKEMEVGDKVKTTKEFRSGNTSFKGTIKHIQDRGNEARPFITVDLGCGREESIDRSWLQYDCDCCCCCK